MAQKQTIKQLSEKLLKAEANVKRLTLQLQKLSAGSDKYKFTLKQLNAAKQQGLAIDDQINIKMKSLHTSNVKHASSIQTATTAQKRFNATMKGSAGVITKATKKQKSFSKALLTAVGTLLRYFLAFRAITAVFQLFNELTFASYKRAIQFEKALGDLSAIVGLTASETSKLSDEIFRVAGSTSFTAEEIAGLQKQLGKLGSSADEIEKLTRPVALLAQALGESPEGAATSLKKFLNQFNQTSEEAGRFSNAIVGIVNESALSLQTLGTSMQYVGPLAYQAGLTFEETASYLGVLADNGLSASRAGTGLRAVLSEAAKSGKPFAQFIKEIADEGLSAAKALDIFGKRGAGAALVLVNNQSAVKSLNEQLKDSDRLFKANAKQMATTQGQIDLLNSAYNKFSIGIGEAITKTNLFVDAIALFDDKAAGLAETYRLLANSSKETTEEVDALKETLRVYGSEAEYSGDESYKLGQAFGIMQKSGQFSAFAIKDALFEMNYEIKNGKTLMEALEAAQKRGYFGAQRLASATIELVNVLREQAEEEDRIFIKEQARTELVERYKREYQELLSLFTNGTDAQAEKQALLAQISNDILDKEKEIYDIKTKDNVPLTFAEAQRIEVLKEELKLLNQQLNSVQSLSVAQDTLAKIRKDAEKARKDAFNKELKAIQNQRKAEVDAINEQAKVQKALSLSAEERAEVEANRSAAVREAYRFESQQLEKLGKKYSEFIDKVNDALRKSEEGATIRESEVIEKVQTAFADYTKSLEELNQKLEDGEISQQTYNVSRAALTEGIYRTIKSFEDLIALTPELQVFFDELAREAVDVPFKFVAQSPITKEDLDYLDKVIEEQKQKWVDLYTLINNEAADTLKEFSATQVENTKARLQSELDAIRERYEIEEDILRSSLNNQLITESQFRAKSEELKKKEIQEQNNINKQIFEAEKKRDLQSTAIETLQAIAANAINNFEKYDTINAGIQTTLGYATILAAGAAKTAAISQRKFYPVKYEEGGMVQGPSHAQGGIPFTVQGQGGYEMEGGEFIVNKKASSLHRELLESINNSVKPNVPSHPMKFAQGGIITTSVTNVNARNEESVNYLKAIAEATSTTAIQGSKPVRAFVSDKDLRKSANERRLRDRNDRI